MEQLSNKSLVSGLSPAVHTPPQIKFTFDPAKRAFFNAGVPATLSCAFVENIFARRAFIVQVECDSQCKGTPKTYFCSAESKLKSVCVRVSIQH